MSVSQTFNTRRPAKTSIQPRLQVTAALISLNGRVLVTRRGPGERHSGHWEFPGGKVESGETLKSCLIREIREELGLDVEVLALLASIDYDYSDLSLTLHGFLCRPLSPPSIDQVDHQWAGPHNLTTLDLLPPDRRLAQAWIKWWKTYSSGETSDQ